MAGGSANALDSAYYKNGTGRRTPGYRGDGTAERLIGGSAALRHAGVTGLHGHENTAPNNQAWSKNSRGLKKKEC